MAIPPKAVRRAILLALDEHASTPTGRPLTIESVAADLHCSRSTLQRQLCLAGTTYSVQLRKLRALVAVKAIMSGANAAAAARVVGLSPDHLRKLLLDECGIGPAGLRRCREIRRTFDVWTQHPAESGTRLYRKRLHAWSQLRRELDRHLAPIAATSPLRGWADQQLAASNRPDFRSGPFRQRARAARARERAEAAAWMDDASVWLRSRDSRRGEQPPISAAPSGIKT
jgi:AraC-like DNA-binding protein